MDIYVGNLPYSATEEELAGIFSPYGPVERVKIITDRETGRSKGFGFVTLGDASQLQAAIEGVNGQEFNGRALRVNASEPRPPRTGGTDGKPGGPAKKPFGGERRGGPAGGKGGFQGDRRNHSNDGDDWNRDGKRGKHKGGRREKRGDDFGGDW